MEAGCCLVAMMAKHMSRDLPEMAQTATARSGRMVGIMLADLHTVRASERVDIEQHIAEAEQLFALALRQGVEIEMSEHKRRKAGVRLKEPQGEGLNWGRLQFRQIFPIFGG
jgi:hypothetical protein